MREILNAFAEFDLNPGEVILDSKIHRFKVAADDDRKSGWYIGYQNHTNKSAETYEVVIFGNFRTGEKRIYQNEKVTITAADRRNIKEQIATAKRKEDDFRQALWEEASYEVKAKWKLLSEEGLSPYLENKRISNVQDAGVRFDGTGSMYVPLKDLKGRIWSYQRIFPDGKKMFYSGGKVFGNFHVIGQKLLSSSDALIVCEGFATGASLSLASNKPVVVAFNAGNLLPVCKSLKVSFPDKSFLICADDDRWKKDANGNPLPNTGKLKAEEAAEAVLGKVIIPEFETTETRPTDFNDLLLLEGLPAVKKQLMVEAPKMALFALGFKDKEYYFTSTSNRQIVAITSFSETDLLNLMSLPYWEALYPGRTERKVDWTMAKSDLMSKCRERGFYDSSNVRGSGVWMDENRVVINMGQHLIVDGRSVSLSSFRSKYFYALGKSLPRLSEESLSIEECEDLINACSHFQWAKKDSGIILAGALVLQRACGALPIRPHVWITGAAQTGKTTLVEKLISKIVGPFGLYVQSSTTTEAGIRQELKSNALPVLFDEFETNGNKNDENITAFIELARSSWSDSSADILKGSSAGNSMRFKIRFSSIVSSIRLKLLNDADVGRFAVLELIPHDRDDTKFQILSSYLSRIDDVYADRLFKRVITQLPVLLSNFKLLRSSLANKVSSRFGDQYGMILAGYSILIQDEPLTHEKAEELVNLIELQDESDNTVDHEECLKFLLTSMTKDGSHRSIQEAINHVYHRTGISDLDSSYFEKILERHGLKVKGNGLFVANKSHSELKKIFLGSKWHDWSPMLRRLPGADKKAKAMILGHETRGTLIPITYVMTAQTNQTATKGSE